MGCSDHRVLHFSLKISRPALTVKQISFRKVKSIDIDEFKSDLRQADVIAKPKATTEDLVKQYHQSLSSVLDVHAPLQKKTLVVRPHCPWFNQEIKAAKAKRRACERKWRHTQSNQDLLSLKLQKNRVNRLLMSAKVDYYTELIHRHKNNQSALFKTTKSLFGENSTTSLPPWDNQDMLN